MSWKTLKKKKKKHIRNHARDNLKNQDKIEQNKKLYLKQFEEWYLQNEISGSMV